MQFTFNRELVVRLHLGEWYTSIGCYYHNYDSLVPRLRTTQSYRACILKQEHNLGGQLVSQYCVNGCCFILCCYMDCFQLFESGPCWG